MKKVYYIIMLVLLPAEFFLMQSCSRPKTVALPSAEQLAFQDMEIGVFIHYSIDTYAAPGSLPGTASAAEFNPTGLDTEQWVLAAKAMGAAYVVLTARHEQGFCLWPTSTTDYSVKSSPYKKGKGDIVKEFVEACRKHGLKAGLYTAPWIDSNWEATQPGYQAVNSGRIDKLDDPNVYDKAMNKEKEQIRELMTNYGPLVFLWDDHFGRSDALDSIAHGGKFREFYAALTKYAHELQPDCLLLGPDVEHVGNESGIASYPLWNALNTVDGTSYSVSRTYKWDKSNFGDPLGRIYRPQLAATTVAFSTGGWMWTGKRKAQPLEKPLKAYYETVGRGAGIIINLTPDRRGVIPDELVAAAKEFGDSIKERFSRPVAASYTSDPVQTLEFKDQKTFDHIVTMENLHKGQKIAAYTLEAKVNGKWKTLVNGQTIGHKRIDQFEKITAAAVRFTVTNTVAEPAEIRSIEIFNSK